MDNVKREAVGLKSLSMAALVLAFASLGDAFLYPFLPINYHAAGIPAVWVGLILSINRFVRIFSNAFMVYVFSKYGLRSIILIATVVAIGSTFGYGLATSVFSWLMLRIMWGLAYSSMRIGALGYALQHERRGLAFGVSRSLQEGGPMVSLFMAPILTANVDFRNIFYLLSILSLPALYFAWKLPVVDDKVQVMPRCKVLHWPSALNAITFVSAVAIDGIIVVVLGILFLRHQNATNLVTATSLAAFYLGFRRICLVGLSAAGGWISDRLGVERTFAISLIIVTLGLLAIISGWTGTGIVIVFTFYSINAAIAPGSAARGNQSLSAIAENATWRDMGAASGTLLGGFLISSQDLNAVLLAAALIMVSLLMVHLGMARKVFKLIYQWK